MSAEISRFELSDLCKETEERPEWDIIWGAVFAQVASYCLENNGHELEVNLTVSGDYSEAYILVRQEISNSARKFNQDDQRSAEFGAYGISALLAPKLIQMTIIEASKKGTGFDFWLGPVAFTDKGSPDYENANKYFQNKARLEVSGIMKGNQSSINSRVKEKLKQIEPTDDTPYPGFVSVVEFGDFIMVLKEKQADDV